MYVFTLGLVMYWVGPLTTSNSLIIGFHFTVKIFAEFVDVKTVSCNCFSIWFDGIHHDMGM